MTGLRVLLGFVLKCICLSRADRLISVSISNPVNDLSGAEASSVISYARSNLQ